MQTIKLFLKKKSEKKAYIQIMKNFSYKIKIKGLITNYNIKNKFQEC